MNIFNQNYRKSYINPYRHGVLVGNFVEDIVGEDLRTTYQQEKPFNAISENHDKFQRPALQEHHFKAPGNEMTMKNNSNFDLNLDFNQKNLEDYMKLEQKNLFELKDKNVFIEDQIRSENLTKQMNETLTGIQSQRDINSQTQSMLQKFHTKDARGLLFSKKSGVVQSLFFGHGLDQKTFNKNEYATMTQ